MPDRGDERGRGGTRTLVTGILAGTEWLPATNPQEATQTAREARDLAVRLRPVLSKLAQAPRGGRRRDLEWLPAVEQLAVDAQYFASWWLPRLEGKSAQSWPSWSADGYADWVKRLDAQRLRTLEMVEGTAPVTRIASVTQLRRGKSAASDVAADAEVEAEQPPAPSIEEPAETHSPARHARDDSEPAEHLDEEHTARITPLRGPGAALMDAAMMDMAGVPGALDAPSTHDTPGMRTDVPEPSLSADETHIAKATPIPADGGVFAGAGTVAEAGISAGAGAGAEEFAEPTAPTTPEPVAPVADAPASGVRDEVPLVPRTPPNQGPGTGAITVTVSDDPDTTHIQRPPVDSAPRGFDDIASDASEAALPRVPRTPPNQGPADADTKADTRTDNKAGTRTDTGVGADILQIPRTPPNSGPAEADRPRGSRAPVVSLVGDAEPPRVPRTPPNPGPAGGGRAAESDTRIGAQSDADATHVSLAPVGPVALGTGTEELTRPLFRPDPPAPKPAPKSGPGSGSGSGSASGSGRGPGSESSRGSGAAVPAAAALAGAAMGAAAIGSGRAGSSGGSSDFGAFGDSGRDEFENFQPGSDLPPPVFPMTEPVEPVDRGRIVRYALAAVVAAAACVVVFAAATHKSPATKTVSAPPSTSSSSSAASSSASSSSAVPGAVTAPTATGTPAPSSTAAKPTPPKSSPPPSTPPKTTAPASHSSAAPPPPPQTTTHQAPPPAEGGVRSLSVSSLTPDQTGSYNYTAYVHVTTNGTGSVTVTVTFAGTASQGSPGSIGAQSQSFTLSGKTSYDIAPQLDVHGMCPSSPYIDAVASASGAGSSAAYASSPC